MSTESSPKLISIRVFSSKYDKKNKFLLFLVISVKYDWYMRILTYFINYITEKYYFVA